MVSNLNRFEKGPLVEDNHIFVEGFEQEVSIGIYEHEKTAPQKVEFNIILRLSKFAIAEQDRIESTVCYGKVRSQILEIISGRHFNLVETLCQEIAIICLSDARVEKATVRIGKPMAFNDCKAVGYELTLSR